MNRVLGFLSGLGTGVGLGMMLAPRSGYRTRLLIQRRTKQGTDQLRQRATEVRDVAADAVRDGTNKVVKETEAIRAAVDAGKRAYSQAIRS